MPTPDSDALDMLLVEARRHLDSQVKAYSETDAKSIEILRYSGTILALGGTAIGILTKLPEARVFPFWTKWLVVGGLVFILGAMFAAGRSYWGSEIRTGLIGFKAALEETITGDQAKSFALDVYAGMIGANKGTVNGKTGWNQRALAALGMGVGLLATATLVLLVT